MDIIFKRLTECKIEDILTAWNRGFEGYFVKIEMTPDSFFQRIVNEGLSMGLSIVGFAGEEPIAIVVNGVRRIDGKKTAWNGGTGVVPEYRGKGVSRRLMEETLKIYQQEGVEVATLEAIKENERAIRLYEKYGYEIVDTVVFANGKWAAARGEASSMKVKSIRPDQLPLYSFYKENVPWQCQWQSVKAGEAQVFNDSNDQPLGYCLFRRVWNGQGELERVIIYQLEFLREVTSHLMDGVLASISDSATNQVGIMTVNNSATDPAVQFLLENGYQIATEQVLMVKKF
ncbi:GNAT family N-acetyltransferase [Neobacillus niacini]|uniref:GNAT family N-acetyltransferase n=1 Tax=Neobacillus niacini TaxID=86668 RepID=UPI0021CB67DD|nr:GNAT family N-acetyltransferase [Neobacillus niacini]MCM3764360.1 GNAT family N-acetyltransferase [Neobacillus niacini]